MNMNEARLMQARLTEEVIMWRREFWTCHGDSCGEDWQGIANRIERLQRELLALEEVVSRRLTEAESVIYGD